MSACQNCAQREGQAVSYDLDLPTVTLCGICQLALVSDRELFDDLGRRRTSKPPTSKET